MNPVLILGGYGNFGRRIAQQLVKANVSIIIAGRDKTKAEKLQQQLMTNTHSPLIQTAIFDAQQELSIQLKQLKPLVVINTVGPFQMQDYRIAEICIEEGIHYLDLADARDFVTGISSLDAKAKNHQVLVVSGASTVPGLSSAVLDHYQAEFAVIDSLIYGISPGQKAPRGLATTQSILTYVGKPLRSWDSSQKIRYGWQNLYRQKYPELDDRWMANCDIPDLDLFKKRYPIRFMQFSAGMENTFLHLGIWTLSWLVRLGLPLHLEKHAAFLLRFSRVFDRFGTAEGGMHMLMQGKDHNGKNKTIKWFLIAKGGDGPQIPCVPTIILAKKLVHKTLHLNGAYPCVGMISLTEYLDELKAFAIKSIVEVD